MQILIVSQTSNEIRDIPYVLQVYGYISLSLSIFFYFVCRIKRNSNKLVLFLFLKTKGCRLIRSPYSLWECLASYELHNLQPIVTKNGMNFSHQTPLQSFNFVLPVLSNNNMEYYEICEAEATVAPLIYWSDSSVTYLLKRQ